MTLRQKISWQIGAMLVGLLLVSGASLWGIDALHQDYGVALDGYQRLRQAYGAGTRLSTAQKLLQWSHPQAVAAARAEVWAALTDVDPLAARDPAAAEVRAALQVIGSDLELVERSPTGVPPPEAVAAQRDAIVAQLGRIAVVSAGIRRATEAAQQAGDANRRATVGVLAGLCSAVVLAAVALGVLHYRGVVTPIRRLSEGVRRLTAGQFKGRVDARGDDELASLARDFNRMADELDGFYHQLERKVADKSRELVRSERLASVGYLAAGVAHEINNPLGIISGYAEYSLAELGRGGPDPGERPAASRGLEAAGHTGRPAATPGEVARSLEIIRDEAFRCKAITQQLLSLARGGDDPGRRPVSLLAVATEVAGVVGGLRQHRDKRLVVRAAGTPGGGGGATSAAGEVRRPTVTVSAVEAEMRQVVLNLTVNALEAVTPVTGEVRIDVRPAVAAGPGDGDRDDAGSWVELAVTDNGRGMSPVALERAFEPFFTEKRGTRDDGRHGTGLGLSITHAIVQSHGGTIVAESGGPGRGSRFVVRLPAAGGGGGPADAAARAPAASGPLSPVPGGEG